MVGLPIMLNVAGRRCVIVGGGGVALRRARALLAAKANVTVIAPDFEPALRELAGVKLVERPYATGDLDGAMLVIAATNAEGVNQQVADDAGALGILVNRTDDSDAGDFTVPAHHRHGGITIAVNTGGVSATAAAAIRRELSEALDPDWQRLIDIIQPYRARIQQTEIASHERLKRLAMLAAPAALGILKEAGEDALIQHCEHVLAQCCSPKATT